jgi:hypothetical protein
MLFCERNCQRLSHESTGFWLPISQLHRRKRAREVQVNVTPGSKLEGGSPVQVVYAVKHPWSLGLGTWLMEKEESANSVGIVLAAIEKSGR